MKTRILSFLLAVVLLAVVPYGSSAGDGENMTTLSPRASIEVRDGRINGIEGPVTAKWLEEQFCGDVKVLTEDGDEIEADAEVPTDSTVVGADDSVIGYVVIYGDVNRDGRINISDASAILKSIAKWNVNISSVAADVDHSGKVTLNDVSTVLKYIVGWDVILAERAMLHVSFDEYVLLSSDPETDRAVVEAAKELLGKNVTVVSEITEGMKYITVGKELWNEYEFMDDVRLRALFPENSYIDTYDGNIHLTACGDVGIKKCVEYLTSADELVIPKGYTGTTGHLTGESQKIYAEAVERILDAEEKGVPAYEMTDDIYTALVNAEWTEPKNIIFMIGDGMGAGATTSAEILHGSKMHDGTLSMKHMPAKGVSNTFSAIDQYTDSAAGGTALSTGYKTTEGTVAMDPGHTVKYKTLLELADDLDKSTGVVATSSITDATPATFTVHVEERHMYSEIARQQLSGAVSGTVDLLLGGGYGTYEADDVKTAIDEAVAAGVTYTKDFKTAKDASFPVIGLFAPYGMQGKGKNEPTIAEMTETAIEKLSKNENGFFLMVEGSEIDSYGHENKLMEEAEEVWEFDCAVTVAMRYAALNPDTVVIVTADHETGGLSVPPDATPETIGSVYRYFMGRHHWINVPVYAVGYGVGELSGFGDNTRVARFTASLMGEEDFGRGGVVKTFFDMNDDSVKDAFVKANPDVITAEECGITIKSGGASREFILPVEYIAKDKSEFVNARAVNVTYRNMGDSFINLPGLRVMCSGKEHLIRDWCIFAGPGECVTMSYVLPTEIIGELMSSDHMKIYYSSSFNSALQITDISVTCYDNENK